MDEATTGVDKNNGVTVCEIKPSLQRSPPATKGEILVNSRSCAARIKIVTIRCVAKTVVNCLRHGSRRRPLHLETKLAATLRCF